MPPSSNVWPVPTSSAKTATGVDKVLAAQEIRDLEAKIAQHESASGADLKTLEAAFVKIAKKFGENRGIGYAAWRDAGVSAQVLRRAGVAAYAGLTRLGATSRIPAASSVRAATSTSRHAA